MGVPEAQDFSSKFRKVPDKPGQVGHPTGLPTIPDCVDTLIILTLILYSWEWLNHKNLSHNYYVVSPAVFLAHGRDSASAAPSCVPGQAVSPIAVLKPWSPVLVKPPAPSSSPQPQMLANFYLPSEEVDGQSSCEIGLRPQDCQIRELGVHLTSSIPSPVAPWPDQAAVCPTHTHSQPEAQGAANCELVPLMHLGFSYL